MRSAAPDSLPPKVRRSLAKLGTDLAVARRKRNLTVAMMAERRGIAKSTYLKLERGDPTAAMGVYTMALFVLGFAEAIGDLIDPRRDDLGLLLDVERLPKRVRPKRTASRCELDPVEPEITGKASAKSAQAPQQLCAPGIG
jgi:DNA-binding XRE family transcriptional regulator